LAVSGGSKSIATIREDEYNSLTILMTKISKKDLDTAAALIIKAAKQFRGYHPKPKKVLSLLNEHTIVTIFTTALTRAFNS
jgi:hypothetical protein